MRRCDIPLLPKMIYCSLAGPTVPETIQHGRFLYANSTGLLFGLLLRQQTSGYLPHIRTGIMPGCRLQGSHYLRPLARSAP